jgi:cellobiose phosphorylase
MVSAWTAELMYQTVRRYGEALAHFGQTQRAEACARMAHEIEADFQRHMMPDGIVAGFAVFDGQAKAHASEYLLHPSDRRTGLRYRLIPMTRGILSGIFTRHQAEQHLDLIRQHLLFPDGARLMDRPTQYSGGVEQTFRRSESASFFGREVGLQYVHAHLRYAEALAVMGRADELWRALLVASPIAVTDVVTNARTRQRNCYFSSSDAAFLDRYEASRDYEKLRRGEVPVDGGWRIYSSGPGIYTSLVLRQLFGLRRRFEQVVFDPILPPELSEACLQTLTTSWKFHLPVSGQIKRITVNDKEMPLQRNAHPYRAGVVTTPVAVFNSALHPGPNVVEILG